MSASSAAAVSNQYPAPSDPAPAGAGRMDRLAAYMVGARIEVHEAEDMMRRAYLKALLAATDGNQCRAAKLGGYHRNTLSRDLAKFDLYPWLRELLRKRRQWQRLKQSLSREKQCLTQQ